MSKRRQTFERDLEEEFFSKKVNRELKKSDPEVITYTTNGSNGTKDDEVRHHLAKVPSKIFIRALNGNFNVWESDTERTANYVFMRCSSSSKETVTIEVYP